MALKRNRIIIYNRRLSCLQNLYACTCVNFAPSLKHQQGECCRLCCGTHYGGSCSKNLKALHTRHLIAPRFFAEESQLQCCAYVLPDFYEY
eukprot:4939-Heterococcus_DN1.PRE.1